MLSIAVTDTTSCLTVLWERWLGGHELAQKQDRSSPHPCGIYGAVWPRKMLASMALGCRSPIRMRSTFDLAWIRAERTRWLAVGRDRRGSYERVNRRSGTNHSSATAA